MLRVHPKGLLSTILLTWTPTLQHAGDGPVRHTDREMRETVMERKRWMRAADMRNCA